MFCSFEDVLVFLDKLGLFSMDFRLDRMCRALRTLKLDCDESWQPCVVQVLGTNGKGSTSTFLASLAGAHGVKTGLYTSPHFVSPRERIRIDGKMLPPESFVPLANELHAAAPELTYFEFLTVLGLLAFRQAGVELVILEAGLGGRYDATTAMRADVVCFTPIDLDHTKILGDTITAIATDKAAAIRPGMPVLTGIQHPDAMAVLRAVAGEKQSPLLLSSVYGGLPDGAVLGLQGPHQRDNAMLALAAWRLVARQRKWPDVPVDELQGLQQARIPGRFQLIPAKGQDPAFILDGGHNPHGLRSCLAALKDGGFRPAAMIFSCLGDKDISAMLPVAAEMARGIPLLLCTIQDNERALEADELAALFQEYTARTHIAPSHLMVFPRLALALKAAEQFASDSSPVLICGSLYLLGEFFTLRPQWLEG